MLYLYRSVTNSLVELGKQQANITAASVISTNVGQWYRSFTF
jgi:hypothetical protein